MVTIIEIDFPSALINQLNRTNLVGEGQLDFIPNVQGIQTLSGSNYTWDESVEGFFQLRITFGVHSDKVKDFDFFGFHRTIDNFIRRMSLPQRYCDIPLYPLQMPDKEAYPSIGFSGAAPTVQSTQIITHPENRGTPLAKVRSYTLNSAQSTGKGYFETDSLLMVEYNGTNRLMYIDYPVNAITGQTNQFILQPQLELPVGTVINKAHAFRTVLVDGQLAGYRGGAQDQRVITAQEFVAPG